MELAIQIIGRGCHHLHCMETSSNRDLLELHISLYTHYSLGGQGFSVHHVRMTFCGAPGALRFDLCIKQDNQATSQSPWAMLTSTEQSMSKENPIRAEHQHWALALRNALTGRRLLFASAFFFTGAKSLISASATPEQSGLCSLGAAKIPAASCQEFINYKSRSAACAPCQRVTCRSLTVCVYASAERAGWRPLRLAGWQGNDSQFRGVLVRRWRENILPSSCQRGASVTLRTVRSLPPYHVTCLLGYLHGQTSNADGFIFCFRGSSPSLCCWGQWKWKQDWARLSHGALWYSPWSCPAPGGLFSWISQTESSMQESATCLVPEKLQWMLWTDTVLHCTKSWSKVFWASWLLWVTQIPIQT